MNKLDLTKTDKPYYSASPTPALLEIKTISYLSIKGQGDPSGEAFAGYIRALYATAYTVKFNYKMKGMDFVVAKLEGLWWFDTKLYPNKTMDQASVEVPREEWEFRLLIRLPEFVETAAVTEAVEKVISKKKIVLAEKVTFFTMTEGKCIQVLHTGPFSKEPETLKLVAEFSDRHGLQQNGTHHEIYLSDFRKTAPEKLRTILREPVK